MLLAPTVPTMTLTFSKEMSFVKTTATDGHLSKKTISEKAGFK